MNCGDVPRLKVLFRENWDKAALRHEHPPQFRNDHKQLLYDIAYAPGEQETGEIVVSRWNSVTSAKVVFGNGMRVREEAGFFDYQPQSASTWHLNFADSNLFFAYGDALFAQDEIQVAEHPILASVREKLMQMAQHSAIHAPSTRDHGGPPTPVLLQGAERRIAVAVNAEAAAGRPRGLYGNRFAMASRKAIIAATTKLNAPSLTNVLAIAAPACGYGLYRADAISDALRTAWSGFHAAVQSSRRESPVTIHTGNWGCGAFGGNPELMYLVQLLAGEWAGVGELVFHAPHTAPFAAAQTKFAELRARDCDYDRVLAYLLAQRYEWGVSDGN